MNEVFESAQHRRVFFAAASLLFIVLIAVRVYASTQTTVSPVDPYLLITSITDNLLSGLFASVLVGGTIYFFRPRRVSMDNISHLNANEIVPAINDALSGSSRWIFVGNRGRYLRSKVLPSLSRRGGASAVELIVLDPLSPNVCQAFIDYKVSSNQMASDEGTWTTEKVQAEVVATVAVCAIFAKNPHLSISMSLSPTFSPIRIDSNSVSTFLTAENKREPALNVRAPHFFNGWMLHHFSVLKRQSRSVTLPVVQATQCGEFSEPDILAASKAVGLDNPTRSVIDTALKIAKKNTDPYA